MNNVAVKMYFMNVLLEYIISMHVIELLIQQEAMLVNSAIKIICKGKLWTVAHKQYMDIEYTINLRENTLAISHQFAKFTCQHFPAIYCIVQNFDGEEF